MRRSERRASWLLWTVLVGLGAAAAGPAWGIDLNGFLPGKGNGHAALSVTIEGWEDFWFGTEKRRNAGVGSVDVRTLSLYIDYGFTDRLALVANLPDVDVDSTGTGGFAEHDLQDLTVLLKYRAASFGSAGHRHSLVVAGGFRTPASDYEANLPVDVGDGTTDVLARLIYQYEGRRFYFSQQVGYDLRSEDAPDGIPFYTELGYRRGSLIAGGFLTQYLAEGGTDIGDPGFTFPSNQEEYTRIGAKVYGKVNDRLGVSGLVFTTLDGRNSAKVTGGSVGLVVSF